MTSVFGLCGLAATFVLILGWRHHSNRQFAAVAGIEKRGWTRFSTGGTPNGWNVFTCQSCGAHHRLRGSRGPVVCECCGNKN